MNRTQMSWRPTPFGTELIGLADTQDSIGGGYYHASDGCKTIGIEAGGLAAFLASRPAPLVAVRSAGDLLDVARAASKEDAAAVWQLAADLRLYDVGLLAQLVGLARREAPRGPDLLGADPIRQRCLDLLGEADVATRRATYAGGDASLGRGPLGLGVEVMAALGVSGTRAGVRYNPERLQVAREACDRQRDEAAARLKPSGEAGGWLEFYRGRLVTNKNGYPKVRQGKMSKWLRDLTLSARRVHGLPVPAAVLASTGDSAEEKSDLDTARWARAAAFNESLADWVQMMTACRLRADLLQAADKAVVPVVEAFPRLCCRQPPLDAIRGLSGVSGLVLPVASGDVFLTVELPDLELRALAFCLARNGRPNWLGQQFADGNDPVWELALRSSGMGPAGFLRMLATNVTTATEAIELARFVLQALPLGVKSTGLHALAKRVIGTEVTRASILAVTDALESLLPELAGYLADGTVERFAENLDVTVESLETETQALRGGTALSPWLNETLLGTDPALGAEAEGTWKSMLGSFKRMATRLVLDELSAAEFYERLAAGSHVRPTGQIEDGTTPWEAVGTDHLAVADAVRKHVLFAVTRAGFPLVGLGDVALLFVAPKENSADDRDRVSHAVRLVADRLLGTVPVKHNVRICDHY